MQDVCNAQWTPIPIIHIQRFQTCEMLHGAESHAPQSGSRRMRRTLLAKWRGLCEGILRGRGRKPYDIFNIKKQPTLILREGCK